MIMKARSGDRIGAMVIIDNETIDFLGYGVYLNDETPPPEITSLRNPWPKLKLDTGEIIWGCECTWSTDEVIRRLLQIHVSKGGKVRSSTVTKVREMIHGDQVRSPAYASE